jgi:hypothetical protein
MADIYWNATGGSGVGVWNATDISSWQDQAGDPVAAPPTINDDVFLNTAGTITVGVGAVCRTLTNTTSGGNIIIFDGNYITVGTKKIQAITSGLQFTTPADWNNTANTIHLFGGGAGGSGSVRSSNGVYRAAGAGGGGGGYRVLQNQTLSGLIPYQIGGGGLGAPGNTTEEVSVGESGGATIWNVTNIAEGGTGGESLVNASQNEALSFGGLGGGGTFGGGDGGDGATGTASNIGVGGGGSGGGGGPLGKGGNGGRGLSSATAAQVGGGGGGGNGGGTNGGNASLVLSGAGGTSGTGVVGGSGRGTAGAGNPGTFGAGGAGARSTGATSGSGRGGFGVELYTIIGSGGGCGGGKNTAATLSRGYGAGGAGALMSTGTSVITEIGGNGTGGFIFIEYTPSAVVTAAFTVGGPGVANYVNTKSSLMINGGGVAAAGGLGGSGATVVGS